ncbi:MAG: hypothetical protein E7371_01285 [Clostridiales bacterium]|nr:hypothetical protein [Clostridiales bacterium]
MSSYDKFVLILCFIVLTLLTAVFSVMLVVLTNLSVRLIHSGAEDQRIYKSHSKALKYVSDDTTGAVSFISTLVFACLTAIVFGFSITLQLAEKQTQEYIPLYRAVYSDSMSQKYKNNTYLFENDLGNQFDRFDLIKTHALPAEEDLKLYDIVVYEIDHTLVIHRIVEIQEPNEEHPNERWYRFQGDYVERPDRDPVTYSQMRAIYRGEKIKFAGSFVMFLQSPAGYACLVLIVVEMLAAPLITKKIEEAERERFELIQYTGGVGGSGVGDYICTQYMMVDGAEIPDYVDDV